MKFLKGMDLSNLPQLIDEGKEIRDFDGSYIDALDLVENNGVNAVRLRIWNEPSNVPESGGYCDFDRTLKFGQEIKRRDMSFMLDFHYSDWWADPGKQNKPKAWENLPFNELVQAVHDYTYTTIKDLQAGGASPDIVQIGNEIRSGLLFPDGEVPNYEQMVQLVNAGIQGAEKARDADGLPLIMIHLDQGGRYLYLKEWFDQAFAHGLLDFDLIGLSYYPFWHGTFADLKESMERLVERYKKPIMVVEAAYAWRKTEHGFIDEAQEKISGLAATPDNQRKALDLVMNITASLPNNMGQGVYYWEPLCIPDPINPGGWPENMGLLNPEGKVLEGIKAFDFTPDRARADEVAFVYSLDDVERKTPRGKVHLPVEASVLYYDGHLEKLPITWDLDYGLQAEEIPDGLIQGSINSIDETIEVNVRTVEEIKDNIIHDANFNNSLAHWDVNHKQGEAELNIVPEEVDPFPAPPLHAVRIESTGSFETTLSQNIYLDEAGTYVLKAEMKGTDTTGVEIRLFAQGENADKETEFAHLSEHTWETFTLEFEIKEPGLVEVGVDVLASPMYMMARRFQLYRK